MDLTIDRDVLAGEVERCVPVAARRETIPIMTCAYILADMAGHAILRATDTEIGAQIQVAARVEEAGAVAIPVKRLSTVLKECPPGEVRLHGDESLFTLRAGKYRARLEVHNAADFPSFAQPEGTTTDVTVAGMRALIQRTRFAAADSGGVGVGLLWQRREKSVAMVGTNGHCLAVAEHAVTGQAEAAEDVVLPRRAMNVLLGLIGDVSEIGADGVSSRVSMSATENHAFFVIGMRVLFTRLLEGKFPAYEHVIPKGDLPTLTADREALLRACRRVALMGELERASIVIDAADGVARLSAKAAAVGEAEDELAVQITEPIKTRLMAEYVRQFLECIETKDVSMSAKSPDTQTLWTPVGENGYRYVVMPIRQ